MITDEEKAKLAEASGALPGQVSIYDQLPEEKGTVKSLTSGLGNPPDDRSDGIQTVAPAGGHGEDSALGEVRRDAAPGDSPTAEPAVIPSEAGDALPPGYEYPEGNDSVYDWRKAKFHKNAIDAEYAKMLEAKKSFGEAYKRVAMFYSDFHESMESMCKHITEFYKEINKTKF